MIFDQKITYDIENGTINYFMDMGNKRKNINDKGIIIDSFESIFNISSSVLKSNCQYLLSYFTDSSVVQLSPTVYNRHCSLLTQTKVSVKRVMEEAATKKLIYIDNSTVNGLCGAVENCVLDSLQRRTIGLFEDLHSTALLKKISRDCHAAAFIIHKMKSFSDQQVPHSAVNNGRFFSDNDNCGQNTKSLNTISLPNTLSGLFYKSKPSLMKYLWIKLALVEKKLITIIDHLMEHHSTYYDETSIMSGSLSGTLFIELIAGPCSLDFSLVKPSDHLWTDPDASELLDRHNIHSKGSWANNMDRNIYKSGLNITRCSKNRPNLKIQHHASPSLKIHDVTANTAFGSIFNMSYPQLSGTTENKSLAKDYVESLHQNMKNVLLYGKNNVVVQPKGDLNEMQGYLSLHQTFGDKLRLKWTPNQLMNYRAYQDTDPTKGNEIYFTHEKEIHQRLPSESSKSLQWDSALLIKLENIVYLHVHQNEDKSGKVTLVCQDGVQHPPFYFPSGGHLLQFLICLENALFPTGRLEPPLLQINDGEKTFPKISRRRSNCSSTSDDDRTKYKANKLKGFSFFDSFNKSLKMQPNLSFDKLSESPTSEKEDCNNYQPDFVFRIIYDIQSLLTDSGNDVCQDTFSISGESIRDEKHNGNGNLDSDLGENNIANPLNDSLSNLCSIMKRQILSRAFYGWLHYYRNLKTVRTKFNTLVHPGSVQSDVPCDASEGLTIEIWTKYKINKDLSEKELYRFIYFGGCNESLRSEVWPRMLGHYKWSSIDNSEIDSATELCYEKSLSHWKAIEIIINQRENESLPQLISPAEVKPQFSSPQQSGMNYLFTSNDKSVHSDHNSPHKDRIINVSNCDLTPSKGFYSSDNSFDADSSSTQDIIFQDDQLICMADNMHRIDKDVDRCDRNYPYFSCNGQNRLKGKANLKKLRNIMITWVWENIEIGYVQGMCDLLAPLLVILDNESLTHACFSKLMQRMVLNFPQMGSIMDENLKTMALLLQIIDGNLYDHMCRDGEITSLYVTYRWFLLDFKRELCYSDVFCVWETIWSAQHVASSYFNLFLALSLLHYYRDIILDNNMEYTDIIKFFNEMAEKHQVQKLLYIARELIESIRNLLKPR